MCEKLESKPATELPEVALYGTLTSHLARTLKVLGLKRVPKDVTPTLQSYLDARAAEPMPDELNDNTDDVPTPPLDPPSDGESY
jgi:hypothetical protein